MANTIDRKTGAGRTNERTTREDRATQPLGCWKAEFRNIQNNPRLEIFPFVLCYVANIHCL